MNPVRSTLPHGAKLAVAGLLLPAAVWLAAATGFYLFVRLGQHLDGVAFLDLAWPARWPRYRMARGDQALAEARSLVTKNNPRAALLSARVGLARSPANREGRLLLAQLLTATGRPEAARDVFLAGLEWHGRDSAYLGPMLAWLAQRQEDRSIVAVAEHWLPRQPDDSAAARLLALAAAKACGDRGDYDRAEAFLDAVPRLPGSPEGRLIRSGLEYERGDRALGLLLLRQLAAERPADAEVHRELMRRLSAIGAHDEARRSSVAFGLAHPDDITARLEFAHACHETGELSRAAREIDGLLRDPTPGFDALLAVADFAARHGDVRLALATATQAAAQAMPREPFALLVVETMLAARDDRGALEAIATFEREDPESARRGATVLAALRALAGFSRAEPEAARLALADFLTQPDLRAENLRIVADRLVALGMPEEALRVLARAVEADPRNQAALTRLVELELELDRLEALAAHARRLMALRRPSADLLRAVHHALGSDRLLFSREARDAYAAVSRALEKSR